MPLNPTVSNFGGKLPEDLQSKLRQLLAQVDKTVDLHVMLKRVSTKDVRLKHPLNFCVYVTRDTTYIFATDKNVGIPEVRYLGGLDQTLLDICSFRQMLEDQLGFEDIFTIEFPSSYLNFNTDDEKATNAAYIAANYIEDVKREIVIKDKMLKQKSIFNNNDFIINDQLVFVVCPFKEEFNAIYEDHIKAVVEAELSMQCIRADEIYSNGPIIEDIWRLINEARVIVADLTERNPNVFYEVGLAHAIGKEVILLAQDVNDIPFDLRHLRTIIYKNDFRGQNALHESLKKTILNFK